MTDAAKRGAARRMSLGGEQAGLPDDAGLLAEHVTVRGQVK